MDGSSVNFWDRYHEIYIRFVKTSLTYQQLVERAVSSLELSRPKKILDAGCGTGEISIRLIRDGHDVTSVDFSRKAIELYQKKFNHSQILLLDITLPLPFPDNTFDIVISVNTLYSIDPHKLNSVIDEFRRVIKKGGTLLIADPSKEFNNYTIFLEDLRLAVRKYGPLGLIRMIPNLLNYSRLLLYNFKIDDKAKKEEYTFFDKKRYKQLIDSKFGIKTIDIIYAGQDVMLVGEKKE